LGRHVVRRRQPPLAVARGSGSGNSLSGGDEGPRVTLTEGLRRTAAWYAASRLLAPLKPVVDVALSLAMISFA